MEPFESTSGKTERQPGGYLAFMPSPLPPAPDLSFDMAAMGLMAGASEALGRLSGLAARLPNPDLFIAMYVRKEAVLSSQIENIECTLDDVLQFEESPDGRNQDAAAVVRYVEALSRGYAAMVRGGISLDVIRELHDVLMRHAGDGEWQPGEFRTEQNWIGARSTPIERAIYVPPPVERMHLALGNLSYYLNEYRGHPPLVACGIAHAQFETIHPFHDGNGRVGRMLIPLMLARDHVLERPFFYPSLFLRDNRREYYDRLTALREKGDWVDWLRFFWLALRTAAQEATRTTRRILELRERVDESAHALTPSSTQVANLMFEYPVLSANAVKGRLGVSFDTAIAALRQLVEAGWLNEFTGKRRGMLFRFAPYLEILEDAGEEGLKHYIANRTKP
jgi:cell filamentation protein, protein adenylyltransferase